MEPEGTHIPSLQELAYRALDWYILPEETPVVVQKTQFELGQIVSEADTKYIALLKAYIPEEAWEFKDTETLKWAVDLYELS